LAATPPPHIETCGGSYLYPWPALEVIATTPVNDFLLASPFVF